MSDLLYIIDTFNQLGERVKYATSSWEHLGFLILFKGAEVTVSDYNFIMKNKIGSFSSFIGEKKSVLEVEKSIPINNIIAIDNISYFLKKNAHTNQKTKSEKSENKDNK